MPAFADVVDLNDGLVRKALGTIVAVAPMTEAAITSILDSTDGNLKALPANWSQLGRVSEDGITWPRETEMSELFGLGSANPIRSDIRRAVKRVSFTVLESRKKVIELAQGVETLGETVARVPATTGEQEVTWDEPELPTYPFMRFIAISRDITAGGELYIAKHAVRAKVTEVGEETWSDQDQAQSTPLTLTFYHDEAEGTALRHFRGGPGYTEVITDEGFTPAA